MMEIKEARGDSPLNSIAVFKAVFMQETGNLSLKKEASTDAKYSRADKICVGLGRIKSTCFKFVVGFASHSLPFLGETFLRHAN